MRSIVYDEAGDASVLRLVEREPEHAGAGQVRIRMVVSGVNPADWKNRAGKGKPVSTLSVPNEDGAGVVDEVGPGVEGLQVGDRVWVALASFTRPLGGTAQEFAVLPATHVFPLPDGAGFDLGATLGVPGLTARRALTITEAFPNRLAPGSLGGATILVAGGAGAVGHTAIQLARWAGATVIATTSGPEKAALATAAGAQHVVNYRDADVVDQIRGIAPDGVDTIVEVAGATNEALDRAVLAVGGAVAIYANDSGLPMDFPVGPYMGLNARIQYVLMYTVPLATVTASAEDLISAIDALAVGHDAGLPLIRFPLERAVEAHEAVESHSVGKVLIDI